MSTRRATETNRKRGRALQLAFGIALLTSCSNWDPPEPATNLDADTYTAIVGEAGVSVFDGATSGGHDRPYRLYLSENGRYVAFTSNATNLVEGDTNGRRDVFRVDVFGGAIMRVSVGPADAEGNGHSDVAGISADGNRVLFLTSSSNLVAGDTNGTADAYLADIAAATLVRTSVGQADVQGDGETLSASLSSDGRFVAFSSRARNLVVGDNNGFADVFRRDLTANVTVRASLNDLDQEANADCMLPLINDDGSRITFESIANNLVPGDLDVQVSTLPWVIGTPRLLHTSPNSPFDVKVSPFDPDLLFYSDNHPDYGIAQVRIQRDTLGVATGGVLEAFYQLDGVSGQAPGWDGKWIKSIDILSADATGHKLLLATEEGGADNDGTVSLLDLPTGGGFTATTLVDLTGVRKDMGLDYDPEGLSFDRARNLLYVSTDDAIDQSVIVYDTDPVSGALTETVPSTNIVIASVEPNATDIINLPNGDLLALVGSGATSRVVRLDAEDRSVTTNINLASLSTADGPQDLVQVGDLLWVMDEQGRVSAWPIDTYDNSVNSAASVGDWNFNISWGLGAEIRGADVTSNGELIVCERISDSVYSFEPRMAKAFVRDMDSGTTALVSVGTPGNQSNGAIRLSGSNSLGDMSVFHSLSSNLVVQTNDKIDVYLHNETSGMTTRISSANGIEGDGSSMWADVDGSGTCGVFLSDATNLTPGDTNGKRDLLLFRGGTLTRIGMPDGGPEPDGDVLACGISKDGSHVAFISDATNLVAGDTNGLPDLFVYRVD